MQGVELTPQEFAYLLAVVHASAVVGLDDPQLFPSDAKSQESIYGKGRQQLEENQWIEPLADHQDEYSLSPALVQMVAVVAGPEHVVATVRSDGDTARQSTLHYLFGDKIVELWKTPEDSYLLGVVEDRHQLLGRISEMLQVPEQADSVEFDLPEAAFQKVVKFAENGNKDKAEALLKDAGERAQAFFTAFERPAGGQLYVVQPSEGEIERGRRASIIGGDWLVRRPAAESDELKISSLDHARLEQLLADWLE